MNAILTPRGLNQQANHLLKIERLNKRQMEKEHIDKAHKILGKCAIVTQERGHCELLDKAKETIWRFIERYYDLIPTAELEEINIIPIERVMLQPKSRTKSYHTNHD